MRHRFVDPLGLSAEIRVERAHHDTGVIRMGAMKTHEAPAVQSQYRPPLRDSERQDLFIGNCLATPVGSFGGQHIVPQLAHGLHNRPGEVLVGVKASHLLGRLVHGNLLLDVVPVGADVGPRVGEVFGAERGISAEQRFLAGPQPPRLLQEPDRDARANDAGLSAADAGPRLDPWARIPEVLHYMLKQAGLFRPRQGRQQPLNLLKRAHKDPPACAIASGTHNRPHYNAGRTAGVNDRMLGTVIGIPFAVLDQEGVGKLVEMGIKLGRKTRPDLEVGICGEHGGEPSSVEFCYRAGMNYVSCSPYRVPIARLAAAQAAISGGKTERMPTA